MIPSTLHLPWYFVAYRKFKIETLQQNENQLSKILDESALKDKITAKRMLSIGYIILSESPRALNRIEGIIQKIYKIFDQVYYHNIVAIRAIIRAIRELNS